MNSKVCTRCGVDKPLSEYHKRPERPIGVKPKCKDCSNELRKERYDAAKADGSLKEALWKRVGIKMTYPEYKRRYEANNGCCEICGDKYDVLCVDHNHETGEIRGLICTNCNLGIEHFKESPEVLYAAVKYLMNYGGRNVKNCA